MTENTIHSIDNNEVRKHDMSIGPLVEAFYLSYSSGDNNNDMSLLMDCLYLLEHHTPDISTGIIIELLNAQFCLYYCSNIFCWHTISYNICMLSITLLWTNGNFNCFNHKAWNR